MQTDDIFFDYDFLSTRGNIRHKIFKELGVIFNISFQKTDKKLDMINIILIVISPNPHLTIGFINKNPINTDLENLFLTTAMLANNYHQRSFLNFLFINLMTVRTLKINHIKSKKKIKLLLDPCPICLSDIKNPCTLNCKHHLCFKCYNKLIVKTCCLCRTEISTIVTYSGM